MNGTEDRKSKRPKGARSEAEPSEAGSPGLRPGRDPKAQRPKGARSRIACLRIADLPLAAECRAHPELAGRPLTIASGAGPRAEVVSISPEAARLGVRRGSSVARARMLCAPLCVRMASPALEAAARAALLDAALSFSPRAALAPRTSGAWSGEAAVFLDASGIGSLFVSERGFASALAARAEQLGLSGRVAIASSRSVALLAARTREPHGPATLLAPEDERRFLAPLPIDLLAPPDALAETLTRFGVRTLGDLLALPKRALGTRLGPEVLRLIALARGQAVEAPLPVPDATTLSEAIDLEFPVERLEPLSFVLQGVLSRLRERLEARQLVCRDLRLELQLEGAGRHALHIGLAAPTLDLRVLMRRIGQTLESDPPQAPVLSAALETRGCAARRDQLDLFRPAGPSPALLSRTLGELEVLCGSERIGAPRVADDHRPDAFAMSPFAPPTGEPANRRRRSRPHDLALRALRPPVRAQVHLEGGLPASVRSAIANGRVVRVAGPWRTTGAWWSPEERFAYDHFDVQTSDGTVARLRLDWTHRSWQIDAVYD